MIYKIERGENNEDGVTQNMHFTFRDYSSGLCKQHSMKTGQMVLSFNHRERKLVGSSCKISYIRPLEMPSDNEPFPSVNPRSHRTSLLLYRESPKFSLSSHFNSLPGCLLSSILLFCVSLQNITLCLPSSPISIDASLIGALHKI